MNVKMCSCLGGSYGVEHAEGIPGCYATLNDTVYIRPCGAFPDGYDFPKRLVNVAEKLGLIAPDECYVERETPEGDYVAIYDPFDDWQLENVAYQIESLVRENTRV